MQISVRENLEGFLLACNKLEIPFEIKRFFVVKSKKENCERGNHAHVNEEHFLICLDGEVLIKSEDKNGKSTFILKRGDCFYQKEMVWLNLEFKTKQTTLLVFADSEYTEENYIRSYNLFKDMIKKNIK
jgi:UDP-2-acetamido-3-amino-2,3-dideoxy-glucuronate N-acetyltransferase